MDDFEDPFDEGILQPPIVKQFRNILDQYQDNGQILKELIQNAEDAGASTVKFLIDHCQYDATPEKLLFPALDKLQGPALFAYNDAIFKEDDWKGIRMIQDSVKVDDPLKVGRFGLGFKSVFHMTDLPGVISNDKVAFIDPQAVYLKRPKVVLQTGQVETHPTTSRAWKLRPELQRDYPSQFEPFMDEVFNLSKKNFLRGSFKGTVFRFPLRKTEHSALSGTLYTVERLKEMCEQFSSEAHLLMLFLKHVHTIEVFEKTRRGVKPTLMQRIRVSNRDLRGIVDERLSFHSSLLNRQTNEHDCSYILETTHDRVRYGSTMHQWLVTQYCAGVQRGRGKLLPLVGVALPLGKAKKLQPGHTFCFLPLPLNDDNLTGLGVHVNGYFEVDQSRTHLKWPHFPTAQDWNSFLMIEVLPFAMWKLVQFAIRNQKKGKLDISEVYSIMPRSQKIKRNWKQLSEGFWNQLSEQRCLYTSTDTWQYPEQCYFLPSDNDKFHSVIEAICKHSKIELVNPPEHITREVLDKGLGKQVTRTLIHDLLSRHQYELSERQRMDVLQYMASGQSLGLLLGLKLLKLENGKWVAFGVSWDSSRIYLESVECRKSLLPQTRHEFMAAECVKDACYSILRRIAEEGGTQLALLENKNFPEVLKKTCSNLLSYQSFAPPLYVGLDWLKTLWKHIAQFHVYEVDRFIGLPIVPITDRKWSALKKNIPYIASRADGNHLDELPISEETLTQLGIEIVHAYEEVFTAIQKQLTMQFIAQPSPIGVLNALLKLDTDMVVKKVRKLQPEGKEELLDLIESCRNLPITYTKLLKSLPLLLCYKTTTHREEQWQTRSEVTCVASLDLPVKMTKFIAQSSVCRRFARMLNVPEFPETQVLVDIVFPEVMKRRMHDQAIEELMVAVMDKFDTHRRTNTAFVAKIRSIPFIQTGSGIRSPNELLDPTDHKTRKMFNGLDFFPVGTFANQSYTTRLRESNCFGEVSEDKLLRLAQYLDQNSQSPSLRESAAGLQEFICANPSSLSSQTCQKLRSLRWLPVEPNRPKHYPESIPWCGQFHGLSSPEQTLLWAYDSQIENVKYLVGSVKPVARTRINVDIARKLFCNQEPKVKDVVQNLHNVVDNYIHEFIPPLRMLKAMYDFLWRNRNVEVDEALSEKSFKWIWGGECFTDIHHIILSDMTFPMKPYLYQLPRELVEFRNMLQHFGAPSTPQFGQVLAEMKQVHDKKSASQTDKSTRGDLQMSLQILSAMEQNGILSKDSEILIPVKCDDRMLKLVDYRECTYCEDDSIDIEDVEEELHIVHSDVPRRIIKALDVPVMMSRYLNAEELDMSYGQGEPLTRRIHSLLEDYKDGFAVLKELIQNADDAGATQVHFIYDKRDFSKTAKSLMDPEMKQVLGPALLCYNDQVFTDDDFENIVKLSGATKKQKLDKVGRFGLGFNVVYNLTDVPSFISRDSIVFFDPHIKYLRQAIKDRSKPGIKLNLNHHGSRIKKLADQFQPFHQVLGCDMQCDQLPEFEGTLFRFPLRSESQAAESELSKTYYGEREIKELFHLLQKAADYLLLFTQNVTTVKVSEFKFGCDLTDPVLCAEIVKAPMKLIRSMGNNTGEVEDEYKVLKYASQRQNGTENVAHSNVIIQIKAEFHKSIIFAEAESLSVCWNISSAVGPKTSSFEEKSIPLGAVALCLKKEGQNRFSPEALDSGGSMFCFLPLPIREEMPVHINGYFAVSPSRRQLCTQEYHDKRDPKAEWNEFIMKGVIQEAYTRALVDMTKKPELFDPLTLPQEMVQFFPKDVVRNKDENLLSLFCESFYRGVIENESLKLFHDGNKWTSFASMKYLESSLLDLPVAKLMTEVCRIYFQQNLDQDFVTLPSLVINQIESFGFKSNLQEHRITLVEFYRDILMPIIGKIKPSVRDSLVCFALLRDVKELSQIIQDCACIPVTCGDSLLKPDQLVDPDGPLKDLYSNNEGPFPKWLVESKTPDKARLQHALTVLGMRVDNITCKETLERARTISKMKEGINRAKCLVKLLAVKLKKEATTELFTDLIQELHCVEFLPVLEKPAYWDLPWQDNKKYASPDESYMEEQKELVGCSEVIVSFPGTKNAELMSMLHCIEKKVTEKHIDHQISCIIEAEQRNRGTKFNHYAFGFHRRAMEAIYAFFNKEVEKLSNIEEKNKKADTPEIKMLERYKTSPFIILSNGTFVSPEKCAKSCPQLEPYLHKLSLSFEQSYKSLVKALHIKPFFGASDITSLLRRMHDEFGTIEKKDVFKVVTCAGDYLASLKDLDKDLLQSELFLPDCKKVMTSCQTLCFNNCPWIPVKNKRILHPAISYEVASKLGVKTIREESIRPFQQGIPFGQSEKLTSRIRRILEGYPCDKEILQELVQNADDAEADVVHFFLDYRHHPSDRVFEGWKSVQGPALLVYNNKPFTDKDLKGIQNLGEGSKGLDPVTTGKYGVGFNCVYHITDTPMFLTPDSEQEGNHLLVAFDPNCKYVSGTTREQPGQMYKNVAECREIFPDVFKGFQVPDRTFTKGTLFRFPLRTNRMADDSEISKKTMTELGIKKLFESFCPILEECLLFLQSVKEITLNIIHKNNDVTIVDRVLSKPTQKNKGMSHNLRQYVEKEQLLTLTTGGFYKHHYELDIRRHEKKEHSKWLVLQQLGVRQVDSIKTELTTMYKKENAIILPKGGIAIQLNKDKTHQDGKFFCLLPLPVYSKLAMHINGAFMLDHESRRNLWQTDSKTSFRFLWNELILKEIVADLYIDAMEVITNSVPNQHQPYSTAKSMVHSFSDIFPRTRMEDPYLDLLVEAIYSRMAERKARVLPVIRYKTEWHADQEYPDGSPVTVDWFPVGGPEEVAHFDEIDTQLSVTKDTLFTTTDTSMEERLKKQEQAIRLKKALANIGFPLTKTALFVKEMLEKYPPKVGQLHRLTPSAVVHYLLGQSYEKYDMKLPQNIKETPYHDAKTLNGVLMYCKSELSKQIEGLPLLLMANGTVQKFNSDNFVLVSSHHSLVPAKQDLFADKMFLQFEKLENMGRYLKPMKCYDLSAILPFQLDKDVYQGVEKKVMLDIENRRLLQWISQLWDFISSDVMSIKEGKTMVDKSGLESLQNWCLFPIKTDNVYLVPPLKYLNIVLNLSRVYNQSLSSIFRKISFPEPSPPGEFCCGFSRLIVELVTTFEKADKVIMCMSRAMEECPLNYNMLESYERGRILDYFCDQEHLGDMQRVSETAKVTLAKLPIFESVFDRRVKLDQYKGRLYSVADDIPKEGMEQWCTEASTLYLKSREKYAKLYQFLDIKQLTFVEAYVEHILCHFAIFDDSQRFMHLKKMKRFVEDTKEAKHVPLLRKLRDVPLMPNKTGNLERAAAFYDPNVKLFQEMKESFPPMAFCTWDWLSFLKRIGLKDKPDAKDCVAYAKKIALLPREDSESKCKVLLEMLFGSKELFEAACQMMKTIPFLPQGFHDQRYLNLCDLHKTTSFPLVCFEGSVTHDHGNLVWSQAAVLPTFAAPKSNVQKEKLSVIIQPSINMVLDNLMQVCARYQSLNNPKLCYTMQNFLKAIYAHLKKKHMNDDLSRMSEITCVAVNNGAHLVKPTQIAERMESEIPPYLYCLPFEIGEYRHLLRKAGMSESVTIEQYVDVLTCIHQHSGEEQLHPNEWSASFDAFCGFFKLCRQNKQNLTVELKGKPVYLLTDNRKLKRASDLIFMDKLYYKERVKKLDLPLMMKLQPVLSYDEIIQVLRKLPDTEKPKHLSSVICERCDESVEFDKTARCLEFEEKLSSNEFHVGILRLIRNERPSNQNEDSQEDTHDLELAKKLGTIEFYETTSLVTYLMRSGERLKDSEKNVSLFLDRSHENLRIYITLNKRDSGVKEMRLYTLICGAIDEVMERKTTAVKIYINEMLQVSLKQIESLLDSNGIQPFGASHSATSAESYNQVLGDYVPVDLHPMLQPCIVLLWEGEFVGYEQHDPLEEQEHLPGDAISDENLEAVYILAKVVEILAPEGESSYLNYQYKISMGAGEIKVVHATSLYRFSRKKEKAQAQDSTENNQSMMALVQLPEVEEDDSDEYEHDQQATYSGSSHSSHSRSSYHPRADDATGPQGEHSTATDNLSSSSSEVFETSDMKAIKAEIRKILTEAWKMEETYRKKVVKRLWLQWHPDKNPDRSSLATKVFQFIQWAIERMEKGLSLEEQETDNSSSYDFSRRSSNDFWGGFNFEGFSRRAHSHRQRHERTSDYFWSGSRPSWGSRAKNPQPTEARCWMKQANYDLASVANDVTGSMVSNEWACLKCHHAAEKALKATQFVVDADEVSSDQHSLRLLCEQVPQCLPTARNLQALIGASEKMCYPSSGIPHNRFTGHQAAEAKTMARQIVDLCQDFIDSKMY